MIKAMLATFSLAMAISLVAPAAQARRSIKLFDTYIRPNGDSRYVVVLSDNSVWWYSPRQGWKKSSKRGLPRKSIKAIRGYAKAGGSTRYVVVLSDSTVWWYSPRQGWKKSSMRGLP